jgi:multidrug efflux pump subunit AcrA (membrane-fusion protein)
MRRMRWLATGIAAALLSLTGCGAADEPPGNQDPPPQVVPIAGTHVSKLVLSPRTAGFLGIKTEAVQAGSATLVVVPMAALLYDNTGISWVYTSPAQFTYIREQVAVSRVDADRAVLKTGPKAGTQVVTVGAAELLGTEYGVGGD